MPVFHGQPSRPPQPSTAELRRILRLEVPVIVKLADRKLMLSEVMRLGVGAIIEFVKSSSEPLDLMIIPVDAFDRPGEEPKRLMMPSLCCQRGCMMPVRPDI